MKLRNIAKITGARKLSNVSSALSSITIDFESYTADSFLSDVPNWSVAGAGVSPNFRILSGARAGEVSSHVVIYKLASPPTGANNVVVSISGNSLITSGAISFTGQHATTPLGAPVTANNSSGLITNTVTGTTVGSIIVDVVSCGSAIGASTQTVSWGLNTDNGGYGNNGRSSRAAGTGGSVVLSHGDSGDGWGSVAVEVLSQV